MGIESKLVMCLATYEPHLPIIRLKIPVNGLYFYVEVLNRGYEFWDCCEPNKQRMPRAIFTIRKFKMSSSKSRCVK